VKCATTSHSVCRHPLLLLLLHEGPSLLLLPLRARISFVDCRKTPFLAASRRNREGKNLAPREDALRQVGEEASNDAAFEVFVRRQRYLRLPPPPHAEDDALAHVSSLPPNCRGRQGSLPAAAVPPRPPSAWSRRLPGARSRWRNPPRPPGGTLSSATSRPFFKGSWSVSAGYSVRAYCA